MMKMMNAGSELKVERHILRSTTFMELKYLLKKRGMILQHLNLASLGGACWRGKHAFAAHRPRDDRVAFMNWLRISLVIDWPLSPRIIDIGSKHILSERRYSPQTIKYERTQAQCEEKILFR